ncbi:MAG: class I SAM-dependent methyltransferase [Candidatus Omnitrophota bacterium]
MRGRKYFKPSYWCDAYFDPGHPAHWFYRRKMDAIISLIPAGVKEILDCATAAGLLPHLLENKGYSVDGFDIMEEFVDYGRQKVKSGLIYVDDITNFSAPRKKYDLILCIDILQRFPRETREVIYQGIANHLRPGGYLLLCNPSRLWFRLNIFWRFFRKLIFAGMIFQDEVCGRNVDAAKKVKYFDVDKNLNLEIPARLFNGTAGKKIVFNLLNVAVAQRKDG